jgi:hypothetical protein
MIKIYREGGINWCWWVVTEDRPDGVYLVGHFRERWEWMPKITPETTSMRAVENKNRVVIGLHPTPWSGMEVSDCLIQFQNPTSVYEPTLGQCVLAGPRP